MKNKAVFIPEWLRDALKIEAAIQKETMGELIETACIARYDVVREAFIRLDQAAGRIAKAEQERKGDN